VFWRVRLYFLPVLPRCGGTGLGARVKNIDVSKSGGVKDLQSGLTTIRGDLADVKTDAKSQFSSQIDAVDTALATLNTKVDAAKAAPSATTLAAVGDALSSFNTALQTLISDVNSTC
jgi:hypothetical protein